MFALLLAVTLMGAFAAAASVGAANPDAPYSDSAPAIGGAVLGSEPAAVRVHSQTNPERWAEQRLSKARSISLLAALALVLGLLPLLRRRHGRAAPLFSSSVRLRRHSVAHRAPPSLQLA
jgi:hypothetical protein